METDLLEIKDVEFLEEIAAEMDAVMDTAESKGRSINDLAVYNCFATCSDTCSGKCGGQCGGSCGGACGANCTNSCTSGCTGGFF